MYTHTVTLSLPHSQPPTLTVSHTHSLPHSQPLTLTASHTHDLPHSWPPTLTASHSHGLPHSRPPTFTTSHSHSLPLSPVNPILVDGIIAKELDLLKMVSSVPIGHHITMEIEECIEGSGTRLLRTENEEGRELGAVVTLWPDVHMSTVFAGGLCVYALSG